MKCVAKLRDATNSAFSEHPTAAVRGTKRSKAFTLIERVPRIMYRKLLG
jgi:isochorismate synthase EntC